MVVGRATELRPGLDHPQPIVNIPSCPVPAVWEMQPWPAPRLCSVMTRRRTTARGPSPDSAVVS